MNALRHGLTSTQIVLPHENREQFELLLTGPHDEHAPASPTEEDPVEELAISRWRLVRTRRVESEYFAQSPESATDSALASLVASADDKGFAEIQRYLAAAERAWRRALKDLVQTQSARRRQERKQQKKSPGI